MPFSSYIVQNQEILSLSLSLHDSANCVLKSRHFLLISRPSTYIKSIALDAK